MIYDIHQCQGNEKPLLQKFIKEHWRANHILSWNDELLNFQHLNADGTYNFIIAVNNLTKEIDGILGYIPTSLYDDQLLSNRDVWGAIWKIRSDVENNEISTLGLLLWEYAMDGVSSHGSIGISKTARKFYKIQQQTLGELAHYYIKNASCLDFRIARFDGNFTPQKSTVGNVILREISGKQISGIKHDYYPKKSVKYIENRYLKHPIYHYKLVGIFEEQRLCSVLVVRPINIQNSKCLRIVDVYGNLEVVPDLYFPMQKYLKEEKAEYIDCLNYGISATEFERVGFTKLEVEQEEVIIPNYFEPFLQKNIKIELAYKAPKDCLYTVFKGDSDQDRPNML